MILELPQNDASLFDCLMTVNSPVKQQSEMENETKTISYLYNSIGYDNYDFYFVSDPFFTTISKIKTLASLNNNWDGYNGRAIFPKVGENAQSFVSLLDAEAIEKITDIFPNSHGTITLEWENDDNKKMALEIGSNSYSYFVTNSNKQPILRDGKDLFSDFRIITTQISNVFA